MANPFFIGAVSMGPMTPHPGQMGPMIGPQPPPPPPFIDPATNNLPLNFKGMPPRMEDKGDFEDKGLPSSNDQMMMNNMMGSSGLMMPWAPVMNPMGMNDPNLMMWGAWGPVRMDPDSFLPQAQHELMKLKGAVLYPPPPNSKPATYRERPPGCRTVFVGGLPETVTEDILREMFENCGVIVSLRLSKKNFAHIRFEAHESVERALYFAGYRMKIEDKEDKPNTGRIHVDYAQARDDLYEFECMQRAIERENRLRERMEEELNRPPSPPKIIQYSDHEAQTLVDSLKGDDTFMKGTQTLVTWLDRGDCNRRTSNTFYSLLQSTNVHIRRLMTEKTQFTNELEQMKQRFRQRFEALISQLDQIDKVFVAASKQKSWDHFTKAQRKNIEAWRKQLQELKAQQEAEFFQNSGEAEMEMSDGDEAAESSASKRKRAKVETSGIQSTESLLMSASDWIAGSQLRDENDVLKCQLEAYKNEVSLLKQEAQNTSDGKDKQIKQLQMVLQGMQQQLLSRREQFQKSGTECNEPRQISTDESSSPVNVEDTSSKRDSGDLEVVRSDEKSTASNVAVESSSRSPSASGAVVLSGAKEHSGSIVEGNTEARLIALVTTFLHVHPFGASIDYIWSYLHRLDVKIRSSELEDLLEKYPSVFGHDGLGGGTGRSAEKKWKFVGYEGKAKEA